ncbi:hypothetical protein KM043_008333 [Ampulex compressa]|nr:hypothetical protein KM043_008333 [Ampulex compressa]
MIGSAAFPTLPFFACPPRAQPSSPLCADPRAPLAAAPNAGSLFSGSGRARKDRDRLEDLGVVGRGGVSAPRYAATCIEDQRDKAGRNIDEQVARIPCCARPWKGTERNVNGHLIGTRECILIRLHRDSNHLAKIGSNGAGFDTKRRLISAWGMAGSIAGHKLRDTDIVK